MHTLNIQLEGNDIQKFLNMAREQFDLKIKVLDTIGASLFLKEKKSRWNKVDRELRNLKTIDVHAGEELEEALTLLGKDVEIGDYKTARDEYLTQKYGL
jgi:hypothetical protein